MVAVNVPPPLGTGCIVGDSTYEHEELGVTGDELCPQPMINASSNMPTPYRIVMVTSTGTLSNACAVLTQHWFHEHVLLSQILRLMNEIFMAFTRRETMPVLFDVQVLLIIGRTLESL